MEFISIVIITENLILFRTFLKAFVLRKPAQNSVQNFNRLGLFSGDPHC